MADKYGKRGAGVRACPIGKLPREVTAVAGCTCGGLGQHATECSIWRLPVEQRRAAIDEAEDRCTAFCDIVAERARAVHGAEGGGES